MYIIKTDYRTRIEISLFDMLLAENEADILADASKIAEDTISTYLGGLYDITAELAKEGNARNAYIKGLALSIAVYEVYQRADDAQVPEKVIKNYNDTMDDLAKVSTSKRLLNLPKLPDPNSGTPALEDGAASTIGKGLRRMGSANRRTSQM